MNDLKNIDTKLQITLFTGDIIFKSHLIDQNYEELELKLFLK